MVHNGEGKKDKEKQMLKVIGGGGGEETKAKNMILPCTCSFSVSAP